jgi:hypothetical protein
MAFSEVAPIPFRLAGADGHQLHTEMDFIFEEYLLRWAFDEAESY